VRKLGGGVLTPPEGCVGNSLRLMAVVACRGMHINRTMLLQAEIWILDKAKWPSLFSLILATDYTVRDV